MPANICIISDNSKQRAKLNTCFTSHPLLSTTFPANLKEIFQIAQQSSILMMIVAIKKRPALPKKICKALKKHHLTRHTPIILIDAQPPPEVNPIADAYLPQDFDIRDLEKLVRQITMGY